VVSESVRIVLDCDPAKVSEMSSSLADRLAAEVSANGSRPLRDRDLVKLLGPIRDRALVVLELEGRVVSRHRARHILEWASCCLRRADFHESEGRTEEAQAERADAIEVCQSIERGEVSQDLLDHMVDVDCIRAEGANGEQAEEVDRIIALPRRRTSPQAMKPSTSWDRSLISMVA
jgi:hypothetical protein